MMNSGPGSSIRLTASGSGTPSSSKGSRASAPSAATPSLASTAKTTHSGLNAADLVTPTLSPIDRFNSGPRADLRNEFIEAMQRGIRQQVFSLNVAIPNLPQADQKTLADAAERMRAGESINPLTLKLSDDAYKVADALSCGEYKSGFKRESKNIDLLIEALTPEAKGLAFRNPGEGFEEQQARQQTLLDNLRKSMLEHRDAKGNSYTDLLINTPKIDDAIKAAKLDPKHVKEVLRSDLEKEFASTANKELQASLEALRKTLLWNCLNVPADAVDLHLSQKQLDLFVRAARVTTDVAAEVSRVESGNLYNDKALDFYKKERTKSLISIAVIGGGLSLSVGAGLLSHLGPLTLQAHQLFDGLGALSATVGFAVAGIGAVLSSQRDRTVCNKWNDSMVRACDNALSQGTTWDNAFGWSASLLRLLDHRRNPVFEIPKFFNRDLMSRDSVRWWRPGDSDSIELMKNRILNAAKYAYETSRLGDGLHDPNLATRTADKVFKDTLFDQRLRQATTSLNALGSRWVGLPHKIANSATVAAIPTGFWMASELLRWLGV